MPAPPGPVPTANHSSPARAEAAPAAGESRRRIAIAGALIAVMTLAAFANGFSGRFVYDDLAAIVENPTIRSWRTALFPPAAGGLPVSGRPLVNFSLALNHAIGGTNAPGYHALNLLIHIGAALLFFGVVRRTLRARAGEAARAIAALAAIGWAVHPLQTEAVTYVVQRAESLMGFFYLATLYAFIRATEEGAARRRWLALSVAACACGMATKEVMVSAPLIVLLYDRALVGGTFRAAWRARRGFYAALAATWLVLAGLVIGEGTRGGTAGFGLTATGWSYAAAQLRAVVLYLKLALWPRALVFDYGVDALPGALPIGVHAVAVAALLGAAIVALRRGRAGGFPGAAFFAILAPTSLIPIVTEPIAEHRMYLPLGALAGLGVFGAHRLLGRRAIVASAVGVAALALLTVRRDRDYHSEKALWADTVAKCPASSRAHYNLARVLAAEGDRAAAIRHYETALAIRSDFPSAHSNLANALLESGEIAGARHHAMEALRMKPDLAEAHNSLGNALLLGGDATAALHEYQTAVRLAPADPDLRNNLASALVRLGRLEEALRESAAAVRARPDSAVFHFNVANTLARLGRFAEAAGHYERTLALDPNYPRARENLATVRRLDSR